MCYVLVILLLLYLLFVICYVLPVVLVHCVLLHSIVDAHVNSAVYSFVCLLSSLLFVCLAPSCCCFLFFIMVQFFVPLYNMFRPLLWSSLGFGPILDPSLGPKFAYYCLRVYLSSF